MKLGIVIGKFMPLHNGSLTLCNVAQKLSDKIILIIITSPGDQIPVSIRKKWLKLENPNAIIKTLYIENNLTSKKISKSTLKTISTLLPRGTIHFFGSESYIADISNALGKQYTILDSDRIAQNIKSSDLITKPYDNWFNMPFSVRISLIRRVVLVGPESVGKSTLAKNLQRYLVKEPFLPEYGRTYETFRDPGPYKDKEFYTIVETQAAHRTALLPFSGPIFIEDTDELVTSVWVEMLLNKKIQKIENQINLPHLYLLMDPSVPFTNEEIRYFNGQKRIDFYNKLERKLEFYDASFQVLTGTWEDRETEARKIIKSLLSEKPGWSELR